MPEANAFAGRLTGPSANRQSERVSTVPVRGNRATHFFSVETLDRSNRGQQAEKVRDTLASDSAEGQGPGTGEWCTPEGPSRLALLQTLFLLPGARRPRCASLPPGRVEATSSFLSLLPLPGPAPRKLLWVLACGSGVRSSAAERTLVNNFPEFHSPAARVGRT